MPWRKDDKVSCQACQKKEAGASSFVCFINYDMSVGGPGGSRLCQKHANEMATRILNAFHVLVKEWEAQGNIVIAKPTNSNRLFRPDG